MSTLVAILVAGLLGVSPVAAPPQARSGPDGSAFRAWFEQQSEHPTALPAAAVQAARAYRYVFIAGFLNEGFQSGYFNQNRRALQDAGVKADAIEVMFPESGNAVAENVVVLSRRLSALVAKGPQKLVLIGHSKGAVETLAFAVGAPDFVRDHVQRIFLVQGAFGGSGIADYITGTGHPLDDRMAPVPRMLFALAAAGGELLDTRIDGGFQSLSRVHAAELWQRLPRLPDDLTERVFFVRSQRDPDKVCPLLWLTAKYLAAYYGPNDGLLAISDQWVPGAGLLLGDLDSDHGGLTVAGPVSDRPARVRRAFTHALLMQLAGAFDAGAR